MITGSGIFIFLALTALSHLALRKWHESAVRREG
jgi:NitT/TauT family transport system permease protein